MRPISPRSSCAGATRYQVFKEQTWNALTPLRQLYHYHFINAEGPVSEVQANILKELKAPVGYELTLQHANVLFVERGLVTNLLPSRDVGAQALGVCGAGLVEYQAGVFNGVVDGSNAFTPDTDSSKDVAGKLTVRPFQRDSRSPLSHLGLGLGGSRGKTRTIGSPIVSNLAPSRPAKVTTRGCWVRPIIECSSPEAFPGIRRMTVTSRRSARPSAGSIRAQSRSAIRDTTPAQGRSRLGDT